jgi:putative transposase
MNLVVTERFWENFRRYGSRRITAQLKKEGHLLGRHKVRKIMKTQGLQAIQPRSFVPKTTDSRNTSQPSPNLLAIEPIPTQTNQVWVGDITYIPLSGSRWAYLAVWMDLFSRRIVGWQLDTHMREELIIKALKKGIHTRCPPAQLLIHSDRGGQYEGKAFRKLLADRHFRQSMSGADNPYDNAFMESCFGRFKCELLEGGIFDDFEDAYTEIFEYLESYYNLKRLHSSLGYRTPAEFEEMFH